MEQAAEKSIITAQPTSVIIQLPDMDQACTKTPDTPPPPYTDTFDSVAMQKEIPVEETEPKKNERHVHDHHQNQNWFDGIWCCWFGAPSGDCGSCNCDGCCSCCECEDCCSCCECEDCCSCEGCEACCGGLCDCLGGCCGGLCDCLGPCCGGFCDCLGACSGDCGLLACF